MMLTLNKQRGFNLIELMISVTIGSFLIIAAAYAFQQAKNTYVVNDTVARLQEQAQFVLDTLDEDARHANFWGRHNNLSAVTLNPAANIAINNDCADRAGTQANPSPYVGWALDIEQGISGTNQAMPAWGANGCIDPAHFLAGTDTLVIRHADTRSIAGALDAGKVYVSSLETPASTIFMGPAIPANLSAIARNYQFFAHGYYVRDYSFSDGDGIPMLRRIALADGGPSPTVSDQEFAVGVEDFQIEFGVDTSALGNPNRGSINRYVKPDNVILDNSNTQIRSIKAWILMRSQDVEQNYTNTNTYTYGEKTTTVNDSFRRLLVSRTFQIRNMEQ